MKKRIILFVMISICAVALSVFSIAAFSGQYYENVNTITVGGAGDLVKAINETDKYNLPFERLNAYTYGDFMIQLTHGKKPSSSPKRTFDFSYGMQSINTFDVLYPINKLTVINNDCIFAEYKLDNNGTILRAYVVFDRYVGQSESVGEFEQWNNYGEMYFAYPELNLERISVYKGDTVRIDELPFLIDLKYTARFIKANGADSWRSEETLILRDGYAIINYSVDSSSSDMITITDITFIPYGEKCDKYPYNSLVANSYVPDFGR